MAILKKDILYPIFLKCCNFATNEFWKTIFEDLSYGKTPYGTYISKGFLCCNKKDKEFSYKIDECVSTETVYNDIVELFMKIKILTDNDKNKCKIDEYNEFIKTQLNECDWNGIRKKSDRDMFIEKFVIEMKNIYKLSYLQARQLLNIIYICVIFKVISNMDIEYSNMKINKISGLTFFQGGYNFEKNMFSNKKILKEVVEKKYMSDNWSKYLSFLDKKILMKIK